MAVTWLEVKIVDDEFKQNERGRGEATVTFNCIADGAASLPDAMNASAGGVSVPRWYTGYNQHWRVRCRSRQAKRILKSPNKFQVICQYEGVIEDTDLLSLPARVKEIHENAVEEYIYDQHSPRKFVANKAGDLFDKGPTRNIKYPTFEIFKWVDRTTRNKLGALLNTVNTAAVTIDGIERAAGTCYMDEVERDQHEAEGAGPGALASSVYEVRMVVKIKEDGWVDLVANAGFNQLVSGVKRPIYTAEGEPVTKPWALNSDGTKKSSSGPTDYDTLEFWPYKRVNWDGFPTL